MTKVSDTQRRILKAACKQPKTDIREFMGDLKSPAIRDKVVQSMLKHGLVIEDPDADGVVYIVSDAGFKATGKKKPEAPAEDADADKTPAPEDADADKAPAANTKPAKKAAPKKREGTSKKQTMLDMMSREEGATRQQLMDATGWQKHSVQGATSNLRDELIEKRGLTIIAVGEGSERVYKVVKHEPAQEAPAKEPEMAD